MRLLLFTSTILWTNFLTSGLVVRKRIINGFEADEGQNPSAVFLTGVDLQKEHITYCGATIISARWLLSAAHCFFSEVSLHKNFLNSDNWLVQAGSTRVLVPLLKENEEKLLESGESAEATSYTYRKGILTPINKNVTQTNVLWKFFKNVWFLLTDGLVDIEGIINVGVKQIILHPKYEASELEYDIALIELKSPLPLDGKRLSAAQLPNFGWRSKFPLAETFCEFSGWGCRKRNGSPSTVAQTSKFLVIPHKVCSAMYEDKAGLNKENEFCAGFFMSKIGICAGDSGSGLMCKTKTGTFLAGVASATHAEHPGEYPGLFTRISAFSGWIRETANV